MVDQNSSILTYNRYDVRFCIKSTIQKVYLHEGIKIRVTRQKEKVESFRLVEKKIFSQPIKTIHGVRVPESQPTHHRSTLETPTKSHPEIIKNQSQFILLYVPFHELQ